MKAAGVVAAQSVKANPIARALRDGGALRPVKLSYTVAEGLACGDPAQKGEWVLRILRDSKGLAANVEDDLILDTQRLLGNQLELAWSFCDRASNVDIFTYDRHVVGLLVRAHTP